MKPWVFYIDAINLLKNDILLEIYSCKEYKAIWKDIELIFAHLDEGREFYCIFDNGNIVLARIIARENRNYSSNVLKSPQQNWNRVLPPWKESYISLGHLHTTNTSTKIELVYRNFMELKTYRITIVQCTLEGSIVLLKMYFAYLERIMAF